MTRTALIEQMPRRKGQAIQIIDGRTGHHARRYLSSGNSNCSLLGLSFYDEIRMILKKFRHVRCRRSEETHAHPIAPFGFLSPLDFVPVVHERTQDKCNIAIDKL